VKPQFREEFEVNKDEDPKRLERAGTCLTKAFIMHHGRMSRAEANDVASDCGYRSGPGAIGDQIRDGWMEADGDDVIFTTKSWDWIADLYGKYRAKRYGI